MRDNVFGERLKEALDLRGIAQRDLASRIGMSEVTISRYVHGERRPDTSMLREIAVVTGVSTDWLLGVDDTKPKVMTFADIKAIRKPMLVWNEERWSKRVYPIECVGVRKIMLSEPEGKHDVIAFVERTESAKLYGRSYRLWTLKPTEWLMKETEWEEV